MVFYSKLYPISGLNFYAWVQTTNLWAMKLFSWTGVGRHRPCASSVSICPLPLGNPCEFEKLYILLLCTFLSLEPKFPIKVLTLGANGKYFIINKFNLLSALHQNQWSWAGQFPNFLCQTEKHFLSLAFNGHMPLDHWAWTNIRRKERVWKLILLWGWESHSNWPHFSNFSLKSVNNNSNSDL